MFKNLEGLVNNPTGDNKSEILAEIKRLNDLGLISKPKDLDSLLTDEKFADLKKQFDSKVGSTRTKWEQEQKDKEEAAKLAAAGTPPKTGGEPSEFERSTLSAFEAITKKLESLEKAKTTDSLKTYAAAKMKDLPETLKPFINITDGMNEEQIDAQIKTLTDLRAADLKAIDESPHVSSSVKVVDSEIDAFLETKK